jgi:hypothetical protein
MGATLEAGKLVAAAWLAENWHSAPLLLRLILVAMIGVLMSLNAVGVFGFLTRAHLDHMAAVSRMVLGHELVSAVFSDSAGCPKMVAMRFITVDQF